MGSVERGAVTYVAAAAVATPVSEYQRANGRIHIGDACLDLGTCRVSRREHCYRLRPKEMGVLLLLAEMAPDMVWRDAFYERIWPRSIVVENALDQIIARLRRMLDGDDDEPSCIETLHRRGYRLIAVPGRDVVRR